MTRFSVDDLPEHLRRQVSAKLAEQIKVPPAPPLQPADADLYRCATCGAEFPWTSRNATPVAVERHRDTTGHTRYELALPDGPPPEPAGG